MRRVRYSLAMSLDGYITGPKGEYDWIEMDPAEAEAYFKNFYAQFDIAVMGRKSFDLYGGAVQDMRTYVFSRTLSPTAHKDITVLNEDGFGQVAELRAEEGKDIWLFGGATLFGSLAVAGLVDTVEVAICPVILGGGLPLMVGNANRVKLKLVSSNDSLAGIVQLNYAVIH